MQNKVIITVFILLQISGSATFASSDNKHLSGHEVVIISDTGTVRTYVSNSGKRILPKNDRIYTGYYLNKLYSTQGVIQGKPVDGRFSRYDANDNILECGNYLMGLKDGEWKHFSENGFLIETCWYRNGLPNGNRILYKDGKPHIMEKYKKGKLLGEPRPLDTVKRAKGDKSQDRKNRRNNSGNDKILNPPEVKRTDSEYIPDTETKPNGSI